MIGEDTLKKDSNLIKSESIKIDEYLIYKDSWRYRLFYQKGTKYVCCGKEGTYFELKPDVQKVGRAHFNLFADDGTLITKDHIYPKSKGGPDCIENFQTMCEDCNKEKKAKIPKQIPEGIEIKEETKEIKALNLSSHKYEYFKNLEEASKFICRRFLRVCNKKAKDNMTQSIRATIKLIGVIENKGTYCGYRWERI